MTPGTVLPNEPRISDPPLALDTRFTTFSSATKSLELPTTTSSTLESPSAAAAVASAKDGESGGLSSGATAGLAGAGVVIFVVLSAILIFFYRKKAQKKKQEAYGNLEDEKNSSEPRGPPRDAPPSAAAAVLGAYNIPEKQAQSPVTSEKAPQVSLRPVTQFMPAFNGNGPANGAAGANGTAGLGVVGATALGVVAAQPTHLVRSLSRKEPPPALVFNNSAASIPSLTGTTNVSSPAPSNYTDASTVASSFVGAAPQGPAPLVYRVLMDFTPSMADELELRAGSIVKVIHEYDDGWALCIRTDRSRQGVCPRTCLSQRPVKIRPNGPPGTPNGAPGTPGSYVENTPVHHPGLTPIVINGRPQSSGSHGFPSPRGGPLSVYTMPGSPLGVPGGPLGRILTGRCDKHVRG